MVHIFIENQKFMNQIKYVFDTFFTILGLSYTFVSYKDMEIANAKDILIAYQDKNAKVDRYLNRYKNIICIAASDRLFGTEYLKYESMPAKVKSYDNIISLYHKDKELYIVKKCLKNNIVRTNIDFVSSTFFMLTRYEEIISKDIIDADIHKRFSSKESTAYKYNFLQRPIVNEYIELLWQWIDCFNLGYKRQNWWGDKAFAACLTHDIDVLQKHTTLKALIRSSLSILIKQRNIFGFMENIKSYCISKSNYKNDPYWTFDYLVKQEKANNFNSSFYFMSGGTSKYDNFYSINDERIKMEIAHLGEQGVEVGYHGSYNSYDNLSMMLEENISLKDLVGIGKYGSRQHYLRFNVETTLRDLERVGILYDTSLGYADYYGFRCGICFPFRPYNISENKVMNIWEIPLILMESTLKDVEYNNLSPKEAMKVISKLIETISKYNGVFTLLWHNTSFDYQWREWKSVYEETLKLLNDNNCKGMSGREIISEMKTFGGI
ncbi:MAG: polysaccharide deacetylase family protein [Clostridiaceae bacterium]|nr:polysaccharide deacetylase family protein [Clostridiaceae bacterium]